MSVRLDLVLCAMQNGRNYLFYAPFCSSIEKGDEVFVDTALGKKPAIVKAIERTCDEEHVEFAIACAGATKPLKRVLARVICREITYEEDKENE